MATYQAPVREMRFLLNDVLNYDRLTELEPFREASGDIVDGVLDEASRLIETKIAPLNRSGDEEGCRWDDGEVEVPAGYAEAYELYWQSGWIGLANSTEWGGQGLPYVLAKVVEEMLCSANVGFALYPGLTMGAFEAIEAHGTDEQKATYLPKLATGEWTGTMCMTEPQAGSDVGAVRTIARPQEDGSYRLQGSKIFITSGEHRMAENIVHFVLARLPDSPAGVRGLSTFVVPKFIPGDDGSPGERNSVRCVSIEHKMGINGSCTCTMGFDDAVGWLVGEPNQGIQNMFTMMNLARIMVGFQGLGQCELATQNAISYAKERRQGRPIGGGSDDVEIIEHADVRRMLLTMKALTESGRAMAYDTAIHVDLMKNHPDAAMRTEAQDWVDLTTPLVKAFLTDSAFDLGSLAVQVYGGHGFIREHGIEQIVRDSKILCLYEGTNGIQSLDLVRRKLQLHNGRLTELCFARVQAELDAAGDDASLAFIAEPLAAALATVQETTAWLRTSLQSNPDDAAAGAVDFLRAFTLMLLGYYWLKMVRAANAGSDAALRQGKQDTAAFFAARVLPEVASRCETVRAGAETITQASADLF